MKVPFIDFSEQTKTISGEIDTGLKEVYRKANFILGEEEKRFEEEFASFCQAKYGVGVNSGTDALYLAVASLDIGPGDEVILPTFTFIATALCISYSGAKPVFVDIEEETCNLDPTKLEDAITPNTKAIIPVHMYGQPAEMKDIIEIAARHGVPVIEDAAQAHGSKFQDKRVGSLGMVGCFSFYPTKGLGGFGDGGMCVTNDQKIYDKLQMLRDYGRQGRYEHKIKGYNSRLDTVQAVVLSAKLKRLDEWNEMRATNAALYNMLLKDVEGVETFTPKADRTHVYQTYAVRVANRDQLCEAMKEKGISVLIHYPIPVHLQEAYADIGHKEGDFPVAELICREILSLPMYPHMQKEQIEYVVQCLKELLVKV